MPPPPPYSSSAALFVAAHRRRGISSSTNTPSMMTPSAAGGGKSSPLLADDDVVGTPSSDFEDLDYFSPPPSSSSSSSRRHGVVSDDDDGGGGGGGGTFAAADDVETTATRDAPGSQHRVHHDDDDDDDDDIGESSSSSSSSSLFRGLSSRPKVGGSWDPSDPLRWCASFGTRSRENALRLASLVRLRPGDGGHFDAGDADGNDAFRPGGVTIVRTPEQAGIVAGALARSRISDPDRVHACDTEVMDIDLGRVGPVGNGYVTCLSVYSGPDFDYGLGDGPGTMLWIDNLDDACGILNDHFAAWLGDASVLKVWHNYGFDRHVLYNEGIDVLGFGGDTLHMARLCDTGRMKYSLESLTEDLLGQRKVPMKEIFGEARPRKDGSPGALVDLPPIERLQRDPRYRRNFIQYSAKDAKSTYDLYMHLREKLEKTQWIKDHNLMDYYHMHMRPFGELLTDLERRGMLVATDYLADVEVQARKDREGHVKAFRSWASEQIGPDGLAMNLASSVQLGTFLFGGAMNTKTKERTEKVRIYRSINRFCNNCASNLDNYRFSY